MGINDKPRVFSGHAKVDSLLDDYRDALDILAMRFQRKLIRLGCSPRVAAEMLEQEARS